MITVDQCFIRMTVDHGHNTEKPHGALKKMSPQDFENKIKEMFKVKRTNKCILTAN